jgi:hypothetical protein
MSTSAPITPAPVKDRPTLPRFTIREFLKLESAGGACLLIATVIALVLANSPFDDTVADFWHAHAVVMVGPPRASGSGPRGPRPRAPAAPG